MKNPTLMYYIIKKDTQVYISWRDISILKFTQMDWIVGLEDVRGDPSIVIRFILPAVPGVLCETLHYHAVYTI